MAIDDKIDHIADFDEQLRTSSSTNNHSLPDGSVDSSIKVIRLLHDVFRARAGDESVQANTEQLSDECAENPDPKRVGRFTILRSLGRGAFGCVFLAHDPILHRQVALKIIHEHLLGDESARRRVLREREVMARLQHPGIVPVWDAGEESESLYIVSEYCPGPTLFEYLGKVDQGNSKLLSNYREVASFVEQLADAVQHSHDRGVVHRDIKPSNILLDNRHRGQMAPGSFPWRPRLSDFGLAKCFYSIEHETRTGLFIGSLEYASPEQVQGHSELVGPSSDIYSLGVILYLLLTGRLPYVAQSDYQRAKSICERDAHFDSPHRHRVPRDLQAITLRALQRRPDDRYHSAGVMCDDLRCYLANEFVSARPVFFWERLLRWARSQPALASLSILCVLFAVLLFVTLVDGNRQLKIQSELLSEALTDSQRQHTEASSQREASRVMQFRAEESEARAREIGYRANMRLAFEAWENNNWFDASEVLNRMELEMPDLLATEWRWLKNELGSRYGRLPILNDPVCGLAYDSASGSLWSVSESGTVRRWIGNKFTGNHFSVVDQLSIHSRAKAFALSPDAKFLAIPHRYMTQSKASTLQIWDLYSREPLEPEIHFHSTTIESVEFSPDGKWLASGPRYKPVIVSNIETKESFAIQTSRRNRQLSFSPQSDRIAVLADSQHIEIYELATYKKLLSIPLSGGAIKSHAWLPNRELLVVNQSGNQAVLASTKSGKVVRKFDTQLVAETIAVSENGQRIALGSDDGKVQILNFDDSSQDSTPSLKTTPPIQVLNSQVTDIAYVGAHKAVVADEEGHMAWLDLEGQSFVELSHPSHQWRSLRWEDEDRFTIHSFQDSAQRKSLTSETSDKVYFPIPSPIHTIDFSTASMRCGFDRAGSVFLLDAASDQHLWTSQINRGKDESPRASATLAAAFSRSGEQLFVTGDNNRLTALKTSDGSVDWEKILTNSGCALAVDSKSDRLFLGGDFETVHVYDAHTNELLTELAGGSGTNALVIDTLHQRIISGHDDGTLRLRDLQLKNRPSVHRGHRDGITSISITPDGKTIVTGDAQGVIRLWSTDGHPYGIIYRSPISSRKVHSLVWSPSGRTLAAVLSKDKGDSQILFWQDLVD